MADMFEAAVKAQPDKEALVYMDTGESFTFRRVDEVTNQSMYTILHRLANERACHQPRASRLNSRLDTNRHERARSCNDVAPLLPPPSPSRSRIDTVANWAIAAGIRPGSVVALVMDNRPEYIFTWLGLAKAGAIIALINTNLVGRPLVHSLTVCKARHFIVGACLGEAGATSYLLDRAGLTRSSSSTGDEHTEHAAAAKEALGYGIWYSYGGKACPGYNHLDELISTQPTTPTTVSRTTKPPDVLFYIYTRYSKVPNMREVMQG